MGLSLLGKFAIMEWRYGLCTENMLLIIQLVFLKLLYSLVFLHFLNSGVSHSGFISVAYAN